MELGFDTKEGNNIYGIFGTYSQGKTKLKDGYNDFKYGGVGAYYTYIDDNGVFVDMIGKYLRTSQEIKLPSLTGKVGATPFEGELRKLPSIFIGSVQTGIRKTIKNNFYIEPTVKVTSGYSIEGEDGAKAKVKSSTPVYGETGVQLGKSFGTEGRGLSVSTGVHYQKKLNKKGEIELTDREGTRKYETMDTDRVVANISVDGKLTESLGVYGRVEKSFGGKYKMNYSGEIGIKYRF